MMIKSRVTDINCLLNGYLLQTVCFLFRTATYFKQHPQLSDSLIDALLEKNISIIGLDFGGVRRGSEHTPKDKYCADRGVFVIENLCNLGDVLKNSSTFTAHTYPMNCTGITGLPCRIIAEI